MNATQVAGRLKDVYDPDLGLDIVALGLVYGIEVTATCIQVALAMTSPECPLAGAIIGAALDVLLSSFPTHEVVVDIVDEPPWDPAMMDRAARRSFGLEH